jgi:N-acetylated-alpha-linked acidic dipeptidase
MSSRPLRAVLAAVIAVASVCPASATAEPLRGFSEEASAAQRALEARFDASLKAQNLRDWMKRLAAYPHHLGSARQRENVEFIAATFREWGFETRIEEFDVLFPTPKTRLLEMIEPTPFTASLKEPPVAGDSTSSQTTEQLPTYNCYSVDGDVTGELVYVNYGIPSDYEALAERGVDVKGKVVIARYGGSWRGIKPKVAAERGAVGCIIYSDPRDDGYYQGDVYPAGAFRNEHGVQRGSVADMPVYPGDPLTPGVGATKGAKRLLVSEAPTLTKIPVLPISYADARPLLAALGGPVAPEAWRGALPLTYHLGPGPAKVRLKVAFDWNTVAAANVVARLRGAERPDEWVIRGNHSDAWVNGADDPVSGLVAMMEEARAVGELAKGGWVPKRTIVYCAWDGEEQGLLGSTEWAETHAEALRRSAVAYVNSDSNGRGFLYAGGSHTLERLVNEVARDVPDPQRAMSVLERARARALVDGDGRARRVARERGEVPIGALGSGSDYTPFLQHLGIACLNIGFGGEDGGGSYHSIYDSFDHYSRFGDPDFAYGVTLARTAGRVVLRLANADVLPFEVDRFAETVDGYARDVSRLAEEMREQTAERNRMIGEGIYEAVADPTLPFVAPKPHSAVPSLDFAPLRESVDAVRRSAARFTRVSTRPLDRDAANAVNQILIGLERTLTRSHGLPRRPWYVHHVYAPGSYTGYGVKTLPGVREAIELRDWAEAAEQIRVVAGALKDFAAEVDEASAAYERGAAASSERERPTRTRRHGG